MRRTTKPTTIKRLSMLLAAIMLTFTTAWAQYEDYMLSVQPNYDGAGSGVSILVSYDWEKGGHYVTLNTPYFEQQFNRGGGHHIVGYSYSSTYNAGIDIDATIELTENPTMLYAIWDDMIHWEVSSSSGDEYDILTFYGPYVMPDYLDTYKTPWAQYMYFIKTLIINEGMKAIGSYAFGNFYLLTSVSLPNSLTSIGKASFCNCSALTTIEIPSNVTEIKQYAFTGYWPNIDRHSRQRDCHWLICLPQLLQPVVRYRPCHHAARIRTVRLHHERRRPQDIRPQRSP